MQRDIPGAQTASTLVFGSLGSSASYRSPTRVATFH